MLVIIVEDEVVSRHLVERCCLQWGYNTQSYPSAELAFAAIEQTNSEEEILLLTDWGLPSMNGLELTEALRATFSDKLIYIIMLTRLQDVSEMVTAMTQGVDDYIRKPFIAEELQARMFSGVRALSRAKKLRELALYDELTGVFNRRMLLQQADNEISRSIRQQLPFALLLLDIDHFKKVNDTHGHVAGDLVLKQFCNAVAGSLRQYDILGRYGGEEFIIMLPNTPSELAQSIAERILEKIALMSIPIEQENALNITTSIGMVCIEPPLLQPQLKELIEMSDALLYLAKHNGRNRLECKLLSTSHGQSTSLT